jgi:hypothetical protein
MTTNAFLEREKTMSPQIHGKEEGRSRSITIQSRKYGRNLFSFAVRSAIKKMESG